VIAFVKPAVVLPAAAGSRGTTQGEASEGEQQEKRSRRSTIREGGHAQRGEARLAMIRGSSAGKARMDKRFVIIIVEPEQPPAAAAGSRGKMDGEGAEREQWSSRATG
jgi:hypothetical protein